MTLSKGWAFKNIFSSFMNPGISQFHELGHRIHDTVVRLLMSLNSHDTIFFSVPELIELYVKTANSVNPV